MTTVKTIEFAGKTVNVAHSEHRKPGVPTSITFDEKGRAEVSPRTAKALVASYPNAISL